MPTISGHDLKDRMLARFAAAETAPPVDPAAVLACPDNCRMIELIRDHKPGSIAELSLLAGGEQPGTSRAIHALVKAGLITITSEGDRSVPRLVD